MNNQLLRPQIVPLLRDENNLDIVRYYLSFAVLFAHFAELTGTTNYFPTSSYTAVGGFFMLSGFLVFYSYLRSKSLGQYLARRARRILPPYVAIVLLCAVGGVFISDLSIQQYTGEVLQNTINRDGIDAFLKIEENILSGLCCENTVIATGGSAVLSEKAMENLRKNGIIIYLDVPLQELKHRLNNITTRGIAMVPTETIESLYNKRIPLYNKYADITIKSDNSEIEKTVERIVDSIKNM